VDALIPNSVEELRLQKHRERCQGLDKSSLDNIPVDKNADMMLEGVFEVQHHEDRKAMRETTFGRMVSPIFGRETAIIEEHGPHEEQQVQDLQKNGSNGRRVVWTC